MTELLRVGGRRTSILAAGESDAKGCSARAASRLVALSELPERPGALPVAQKRDSLADQFVNQWDSGD